MQGRFHAQRASRCKRGVRTRDERAQQRDKRHDGAQTDRDKPRHRRRPSLQPNTDSRQPRHPGATAFDSGLLPQEDQSHLQREVEGVRFAVYERMLCKVNSCLLVKTYGVGRQQLLYLLQGGQGRLRSERAAGEGRDGVGETADIRPRPALCHPPCNPGYERVAGAGWVDDIDAERWDIETLRLGYDATPFAGAGDKSSAKVLAAHAVLDRRRRIAERPRAGTSSRSGSLLTTTSCRKASSNASARL